MSSNVAIYQPRLSSVLGFMEYFVNKERKDRAFNAVESVSDAKNAEREEMNDLPIMRVNNPMSISTYKALLKLIFQHECGSKVLALFEQIAGEADSSEDGLTNSEVALAMVDHPDLPDVLKGDNFFNFFGIKNTGRAADNSTAAQERVMKAGVLESWADLIHDQLRSTRTNADGSFVMTDMLPLERQKYHKMEEEMKEKEKSAMEKAAVTKPAGTSNRKRKKEDKDIVDLAVEDDKEELQRLKTAASSSSSSSGGSANSGNGRMSAQNALLMATTNMVNKFVGTGPSTPLPNTTTTTNTTVTPAPAAAEIIPVPAAAQEAWQILHNPGCLQGGEATQPYIDEALDRIGCTGASMLQQLDQEDVRELTVSMKKIPARRFQVLVLGGEDKVGNK